ncbi:OLC1v1028789C1 [Oldenlandia corymbosa var. corymbosa]|uniref:OLC1v1028789C1 n=1 Tax=Oldenlandia corymbosa var. corymbosa TaxID=529605 RepID=A0AAV1CCS1_OLDCO|nr:OLC1v1028789C1 [Oldenlandia corymbosa var. corymbosa]
MDEQIDYGDEEYGGGSQKMQYHHGAGAISALADDEMINEDDECDDLYNDVNVGEGFMQMQQRAQAPLPPPVGVGNGGFQGNNATVPGSRGETVTAHQVNAPGSAAEGKYGSSGIQFPDQKVVQRSDFGTPPAVDASQKVRAPEIIHSSQPGHSGYQGLSIVTPQNVGLDSHERSGKVAGEPVQLLNSGGSGNLNVIQPPISTENPMRPGVVENGNTMVFVGELHWWTTDAELESVLMQYGRVKEIKFYDERASGKSKGYCQVEFFDPSAAAACKEGMNGHVFNGRACVVALASPQTIKQMASSYMNKTQVQVQSQAQGRRPMNNDGTGRGNNGANVPGGDGGRNFGRGGGWGGRGGGQTVMPNKGPGIGPGRGRGGAMGAKNMVGNMPGGPYGQGLAGPGFGGPPAGLMHPQGMMGPGFDPTFMGRGAGYGGFTGPAFPGMIPPFPGVNPMGLAGVAPHVNPAFFGRGMGANGMNMMGATGMDGPHSGMWNDANMAGWGGERTRESSYGGEDNASEYEYGGEASQDKGMRSNAAPTREKERGGSERDWSGSSERRHRDEREHDRDRYDRDHHRYKEEKDNYREHRHKERDPSYDDDYDRGQPSKSRSRSRAIPEEDRHRSRSRDADYGKRRRLPSE